MNSLDTYLRDKHYITLTHAIREDSLLKRKSIPFLALGTLCNLSDIVLNTFNESYSENYFGMLSVAALSFLSIGGGIYLASKNKKIKNYFSKRDLEKSLQKLDEEYNIIEGNFTKISRSDL